MARVKPWLLSALALLACAREPDRSTGLGRRVAAGPARNLSPSPDGGRLAFLDRCARPPGAMAPPGIAICDLVVVPAEGGSPARVAEGVPSLPAALTWSPDGGSLAALAEYDFTTGRGALVRVGPDGQRTRVAASVGFHGFGPRGELVFVSAGNLLWAEPGADPVPVAGATGVATFEFAPRSAAGGPTLLLARRERAAGGELLAVAGGRLLGAEARKAVGDYGFSPDGQHVAATVAAGAEGYDLEVGRVGPGGPRLAQVARGVQSFGFSRDGRALAFIAGMAPGKPGDLHAALLGEPGAPVRPVLVAKGVGEYRWAATAPRLAWLQDYDPRVRAGTLSAGGPGLKPVLLGRNVSAFDLTPDGARVAFLEHVTGGGYSVDLELQAVAEGARPELVAQGVFGFDFSPDGAFLYYRTNCVRQADACDLHAIPAAGPGPGQAPRKIAEGVKSFEFDRRSPERLLLTWARKDMLALDLGILEKGRVVAVDQAALPGSAVFLGPDSSRLAYVVADPKRAGVYVAKLPR